MLIAAEVALSVVLVAGAGLMIRSFMRISAVDLGFNPDGLVTMELLPLDRAPGAHKQYYTALLQRVKAIPGVESAGLVDSFALGGGAAFSSVRIGDQRHGVGVVEMMPGYFEAIGARLVAGRYPTEAEYASGFRAVVLNESAAREQFPGGPAMGRELVRAGRDSRPFTVVGVIANLRHGGPLGRRGPDQPQVFFPFEPTEFDLNQPMLIVVRPSGRVLDLAGQLRLAAQSIGPRVLIESIRTGHDWFGDRVVTPRRRTVLLGLLGGLGLVLALVGVFGMTAYAVARRTTEIGVRMALGARPSQVVGTILGDAALPIAVGVVADLGGAAMATRVIESFLFETTPTDPVTLSVVATALAVAGCLAALVPALRAAQVDPTASLRAESRSRCRLLA